MTPRPRHFRHAKGQRMTARYYILDGTTPVPGADVRQWAAWLETADRVVAQTSLTADIQVSTVFVGMNPYPGVAPPRLFETLVLWPGDPLDGETVHTPTWAAALAAHTQMVLRVRAALCAPSEDATLGASDPLT